MRSLKEANIKNKTVILRTNFDVPLKSGRVVDDTRIKDSLLTIKYLLKNKAKVLIVSHLGRPKGRDKKLSLVPVFKRLKKLLKKPLIFISDIMDSKTKDKIDSLDPGAVVLFENIRFYEEETMNKLKFAKKISELADLYVNDAFPVDHRAHASLDIITKFLPSFASFSLDKEINELSKVKDSPQHPFVVVIGGVKVSDKIGVILNLAKKADYILIGGAADDVFLKIQGYKLGDSLIEDKALAEASKILKKVSLKIILPIDAVIASSLMVRKTQTVNISSIPSKICSSPYAIYDIGPKTIIKWSDIIKTAKTIFWSGPLGAFEYKPFTNGTKKIARAISRNSNQTVVGGGDTISALSLFKIRKFTHISTAGSAMLKYIAGEELPGIKALDRKVLK